MDDESKEKQKFPLERIERAIERTEPFMQALSVLQEKSEFAKLLDSPGVDKMSEISHALTQGLFDDSLSKALTQTLAPIQNILGTQSVVSSLGISFEPLIKPDIVESIQKAVQPVQIPRDYFSGLSNAFQPLLSSLSIIDTSWLRGDNSWLVSKSALSCIDTSQILGIQNIFADLCRIERETSLIASIPDTLIGVSSQIASIVSSINPKMSLEGISAANRLIFDYCGLASRQYIAIQKATDQAEVEWRFGVIDAASKYVDRQVAWSNSLTDRLIDANIIDVDEADITEVSPTELSNIENSAVAMIPTHIGYTRKNDVHITPAEGLENSSLVTITEKGKQIAEKIITINNLQLDEGKDRIFSLTETVLKGLLDLGTIVCTGNDNLGKIIDALYFVFYENLEHIKKLIGKGDSKIGDELVRKEAIYECIFNVKTLRSDLRHDLDHGPEKQKKKKLKNVGDCYKLYCGNRPLKEKDFKTLQERIYDEILILEDALITMQTTH